MHFQNRFDKTHISVCLKEDSSLNYAYMDKFGLEANFDHAFNLYFVDRTDHISECAPLKNHKTAPANYQDGGPTTKFFPTFFN